MSVRSMGEHVGATGTRGRTTISITSPQSSSDMLSCIVVLIYMIIYSHKTLMHFLSMHVRCQHTNVAAFHPYTCGYYGDDVVVNAVLINSGCGGAWVNVLVPLVHEGIQLLPLHHHTLSSDMLQRIVVTIYDHLLALVEHGRYRSVQCATSTNSTQHFSRIYIIWDGWSNIYPFYKCPNLTVFINIRQHITRWQWLIRIIYDEGRAGT